jgi:hypothetical protein
MASSAAEEYGQGHARLLDLLDPPPPPKNVDDDEEEDEEDEEDEEAAKAPPLPAQVQAQRDCRSKRDELEARLGELKSELQRQIQLNDERAAAEEAAAAKAAAKEAKAAARAARLAAGEEGKDDDDGEEEEEEEEEPEEEAPEEEEQADGDEDEEEPAAPERSVEEIEAEIQDTKAARLVAIADEADASVVCLGLQAADRPREGPVRCAFDAAYVEVEGRAQVWGTAQITLDQGASEAMTSRLSDLLLIIDLSAAAAPHLSTLQRSLFDLVKCLEPTDRVCIVGVTHGAKVLLEWTQMDGEGKAECREAIRAFDPRGGVSFAPALASAFRVLGKAAARAAAKNTVPSALFLSVAPPADATELTAEETSLAGAVRAGVAAGFGTTLSTVGIGSDCDSALLVLLAEAGRGTFTHVTDCSTLSEQLGRLLALSRTTVASHLHAMVEAAAPVELLDVEPGYGVSTYNASTGEQRKSTFFRSGAVRTIDLGPLHALQQRSLSFKVALPTAAHANKLSKQTPLARIVFVYQTGEGAANACVHTASLRAVDVPRLCIRKPVEDGLPLRFLFDNEEEDFDHRPFQEALAEMLGVKNASVPVDKVTTHQSFHTGQSVVDLRIARQTPQRTAELHDAIVRAFEAGELAALGQPGGAASTAAPPPEDGRDEDPAGPVAPRLTAVQRPGFATLTRVAQRASTAVLSAAASGDAVVAKEALGALLGSKVVANTDPAGAIRAQCDAELALALNAIESGAAPHLANVIGAAHRHQHFTGQSLSPALNAYVTPAARKLGDSLAIFQCDREQIPLQMDAPSAAASSSSSLHVGWAPAQVYSGAAVASYVVSVVEAGTGREIRREFRTPRTSCCIDGLDVGAYFVSIAANNGTSRSAFSPVTSCAIAAVLAEGLLGAKPFVGADTGPARWRWYPCLQQWDRVPEEADAAWPAPMTSVQCVRDSVPAAPTWRIAPSSSSTLDVVWDETDGNGAALESFTLLVMDDAGVQRTLQYGADVRKARVTDLAPGDHSVAMFATNGVCDGLLSDPQVCTISAEAEAEAPAKDYFEFSIGGKTYTRPL